MSHQDTTAFIGGYNQSMGEKRERVHRLLRPLPHVDMFQLTGHIRYQCRCGECIYCVYRSRCYCWTCGKRAWYLSEEIRRVLRKGKGIKR